MARKSELIVKKQARETRGKPGPKAKTLLDVLIPKVWYWAVKARGNWSDSDLDVEFIPDEHKLRHVKETRVRAFESIRRRGVMPSSGKHRLRDFNLVERVNLHPNFSGTSSVINSPFWRLLKAVPGDLTESSKLVAECLESLGLKRVYGNEALDWWEYCTRKTQAEDQRHYQLYVSEIEWLLQRATGHLPINLDLLALFGSMYRESCLSFKLEKAEVLAHYFCINLMRFCDQSWISAVASEFHDIATHRILYGEKDYLPIENGAELPTQAIYVIEGVVIKESDARHFNRSG